ncbi:unnamed protein product, partial [Rotaria sordida]
MRSERTTEALGYYLPNGHPDFGKIHNNIGIVHAAKDQRALARQELETALQLLQALHSNQPHPDIATCISNIGSLCRQLKDYDTAKDLQKQALEIRIQTLPLTHIDIAMSFHNLGI